jgi:uncharacterized protein (TIGR00369 family)|tara:strand:- start:2774 stop:3199 length:426 start_codon:yes stop_codon:yes gene_type:complete
MTDIDIVAFLNSQWPPSVNTLEGYATEFDTRSNTLEMSFVAKPEFCHSGDIVQGGYITGMLDAVMAYSVFGCPKVDAQVATLELKVSFFSTGNSGKLRGIGRISKLGRSISFLSGELYQGEKQIAAATSTVKMFYPNANSN